MAVSTIKIPKVVRSGTNTGTSITMSISAVDFGLLGGLAYSKGQCQIEWKLQTYSTTSTTPSYFHGVTIYQTTNGTVWTISTSGLLWEQKIGLFTTGATASVSGNTSLLCTIAHSISHTYDYVYTADGVVTLIT